MLRFLLPVCMLFTTAVAQDTLTFWQHIHYTWQVNGLATTGNTERYLLDTPLQLQYADSVLDLSLNPQFIYGEQTVKLADGSTVRQVQEREYKLAMNLGFFSQRRFYGFIPGWAEQSNLRGIQLRMQGGLGGGWHILRSKTQKLSLTAAVLYESTDFLNPEAKDYALYRGSIRLKGKHSLFKDRLRFTHLTNYLPSLALDDNILMNSQLGLEVPVNKRLAFRMGYTYTYEFIVAPGRQRTDQRLTLGVTLTNL